MIEIFKPIKGYEGYYSISNLGRVKNVRTERILKSFDNKSGYLTVKLSKNGKVSKFYVHRLVAEMFISNQNNYNQVNHIDEDKTNNCVDNLEWCTQEYNMNYGTRTIRQKETNIKNGYWSEDPKQHRKNYYQEHKEEAKQYYSNNIDHIKEVQKNWRNQHKEYFKEYMRKYRCKDN